MKLTEFKLYCFANKISKSQMFDFVYLGRWYMMYLPSVMRTFSLQTMKHDLL